MIDLAFSIALWVAAGLAAGAIAVRRARPVRAPRASVDRDGLPRIGGLRADLDRRALAPLARKLVRWRVGPSTISWTSLALGVCAGCSIGVGHFGLGAAMGLSSSACGAVDGAVAREMGSTSYGSAVLDATVDRYAELFVFGGAVMSLRTNPAMLIVALAAMAGAAMVTYAGAKADALRADVPRAFMDRRTRATCLVAGVALMPIASAACGRLGAPAVFAQLPLAAMLAFIAVTANASALLRLAAIVRAVPQALPRSSRRSTGFTQIAAPQIDGADIAATEIASNGHATAGDALH